MNRNTVLALATTLVSIPVLGSNPGQPLDCSDWVFLEQGLSCSPWVAYPCDATSDPFCDGSGQSAAFDNVGREYRIRVVFSVRIEQCGGIDRLEVIRFDGSSAPEVVAFLETRCTGPSSSDIFDATLVPKFVFDDKQGRFMVRVRNRCFGSCSYSDGYWVASISGFATTFDVLQTFTPTANQLGFRTPYMPEGLPAADWFDTYYGDLATVGDWSQAQPLECEYPASMPSVGDYLTVSDTLPNPAPGQGRYYVTAVNYQGQTRYGRKAMGGVLSGRDPAVLPECIDQD